MRPRLVGISLVFLAAAFSNRSVRAQDQPQPQSSNQSGTPKPLSKKANQKRAKKAFREMDGAFGDWLNQDVPYIITDDERKAFLALSTNEEREQFIETFWQRRNPDPDSGENTFKEEHYRRIAYANEHFSSGIPGWKTDRGHIYILWGPPDEIDSHPTGGTYDRPPEEGGGTTTTYPWEKWRYRHLEGIGENVELEFVDPGSSGEFHLTRDPGEKDALAHVPGAGPTLLEAEHLASKADRFSNPDGTTLGAPIGMRPASMDEFESLDRYFKVQRPPEHFKDMTALVSSRVVGDPLHLDYDVSYFRVTADSDFVPVTVQIPNRELGFRNDRGVHSAVLNLYGRISTPSGRVVQTFEDVISRDIPESLFAATLAQSSIYQKAVPLRPGLYRLDVVVKDVESAKIGVIGTALRVPRYEEESLDGSTLIIADQVERVATRQIGVGQFVLGSYKVRPRLSRQFSSNEKLGIFLQLYNAKVEEASHKSDISVAYRILSGKTEVWRTVEAADSTHQMGEQVTLDRLIPLSALTPGSYALELTATDQISGKTLTRTAEFNIQPGVAPAPSN